MHEALHAWRDLLGHDHVLTDSATLTRVETATFATSQRVYAVLQPGTSAEVQACVKIANRYQISLYPISGGKNWGLGSQVPVQGPGVLLDLRRLNRIVDYDETLAYFTVEPGVTFRQAYHFLREQHSGLFLSVIGGSPDASLVGNVVERGDGHGPYGERLDFVCGLEVVLPNGQCIHTGFGRFAQARAAAVGRWGVGPYLDGLFTQSNLGIVTKLTMWLMPLPVDVRGFTCVLEEAAYLPLLIDTVRTLTLQEVLRSHCFSLWNCYKMLARQQRYPWELMQGQTPLALASAGVKEPWFGCGAIYSPSQEQGLLQCKLIERALAGITEQLSFFQLDAETMHQADGLLMGIPTELNVKSMYWRKKTAPPETLDPGRDQCGLLWLCPLLPMDGEQVLAAIGSIEAIINSYGFEPNIGLTTTSGRSLHGVVALAYDREIAGEDQRAMACHDAVLSTLAADGYLPFRLGIQSMSALPAIQDDYISFLHLLKRTLDPQDILAPGRYDFRSEWGKTDER